MQRERRRPGQTDFAVVIDFERHSPDPGRVFRAADQLIRAFDQIDRTLVTAIDSRIEPVLLLEDLEAESLKIWLSAVLKITDDTALRWPDWNHAVGAYLVKGKYILADFFNRSPAVTNLADLEAVIERLQQAASDTQVLHLPAYQPVAPLAVARNVGRLAEAVAPLQEKDRVTYVSVAGSVPLDLTVKPASERFEEMLTRDTLTSTRLMILIVKKPDYLGQSRWEFHHDARTIEARINDVVWLKSFQDREVDVRPGDALRAEVKQTVRYGHDNHVISTHYSVERVIGIITAPHQVPLTGRLLDA